jgi:hypothetical protein
MKREGRDTVSEQMIMAQDLRAEEELILSHNASGRLYVDDERVWPISALGDGIVALTTGARCMATPARAPSRPASSRRGWRTSSTMWLR